MSLKVIILIQGIYYLATALWPLFHMPSFKIITGYNKKDWLVDTVSLMILCSGLVFLYAGISDKEISVEVLILSISNILVLSGVDIYFALKGVIRKIYLADAFVEVVLLAFIGHSFAGAR